MYDFMTPISIAFYVNQPLASSDSMYAEGFWPLWSHLCACATPVTRDELRESTRLAAIFAVIRVRAQMIAMKQHTTLGASHASL